MDIHKPKAAHSWREFLIEIGTIVCGIVIAIGLEQTVEAVHWAKLVKEGRVELREELATQAKGWAYRVHNQPCNVQRLKDVEAILDDLDEGRPVGNVEPFAAPYGAYVPQAVWRNLTASGVVAHLDPKESLILSRIYSDNDETQSWNASNETDWSTIQLIVGRPSNLPRTDRSLVRVAVSRELLLEKVWDSDGRDQLERTLRLGVSPAPPTPPGSGERAPECEPLRRS